MDALPVHAIGYNNNVYFNTVYVLIIIFYYQTVIKSNSRTKVLPVPPLLPLFFLQFQLLVASCVNQVLIDSLLQVDHVVFLFFELKLRHKLFLG